MAASPLVIVGCTDRKSLPVSSDLKLRNLPTRLSVEEASLNWIDRYAEESKSNSPVQLRDLYQGEYWKVALSLGAQYDTLVASAGIGMHRLSDVGIGYTATFTRGVEDSVSRFSTTSSSDPRQRWWASLHTKKGPGWTTWMEECAPKRGRRTVLLAVSEGYQSALASDLIEISNDWADVIVVSGSKPIELLKDKSSIQHIQVSQELRMVLGGSTPCVGVRFVGDFLESTTTWNGESAHVHLEKLNRNYQKLSPEGKLPVINRTPFSNDQEVVNWIKATIKRHRITHPTKSNLLRILRDEGRACEQKRFGVLFEAAQGRPSTARSTVKRR